jgi:hypothetical protein
MTDTKDGLPDKLPDAPWSVDPDGRGGYGWNMHILDAHGDRICFMANRDGYALVEAAPARSPPYPKESANSPN